MQVALVLVEAHDEHDFDRPVPLPEVVINPGSPIASRRSGFLRLCVMDLLPAGVAVQRSASRVVGTPPRRSRLIRVLVGLAMLIGGVVIVATL